MNEDGVIARLVWIPTGLLVIGLCWYIRILRATTFGWIGGGILVIYVLLPFFIRAVPITAAADQLKALDQRFSSEYERDRDAKKLKEGPRLRGKVLVVGEEEWDPSSKPKRNLDRIHFSIPRENRAFQPEEVATIVFLGGPRYSTIATRMLLSTYQTVSSEVACSVEITIVDVREHASYESRQISKTEWVGKGRMPRPDEEIIAFLKRLRQFE